VTVFVDSSGLVKLYVPEAQHETVVAISEAIVISVVARVEVPSALWRKQRIGELTADDAGVLSAAFAADLAGDDDAPARFASIGLVDDVLDEAVAAVSRHGLRAYDGIQLASAIVARRAVADLDAFVAFDLALRRAAAAEGFAVRPSAVDR